MATTATAAKNGKQQASKTESAKQNNVVPYGSKAAGIELVPAQTEKAIQAYQHGSLPNNRPITASNLQVADVNSLPNHRPVFVSDLHVAKSNVLPDHRPIFTSNLQVQTVDYLPQNRPVGSNAIDADQDLMGFID